MKIQYAHYMPDSPSYVGPVTFAIEGQTITQTTEGDDREQVFAILPKAVPAVTAVRDMVPGDGPWIMSHLSEGSYDYLEGRCENIDPDKVKVLGFEDGSTGFLILFGEVCFYTLVAGEHHYDVAENEVVAYTPFKPADGAA